MAAFYFIRHATPDWERKDLVYHIVPGPPLTEKGKKEARKLANFLSNLDICQIYTSPLDRCYHTARIIAAKMKAKIIVAPELIEWQPGETPEAVRARICPFLDKLLQKQNGRPQLIVTHGGPIAAILEGLGMSPETVMSNRVFDHSNLLPPAGIWRAEQRNGEWCFDLIFQPG